MTDPTLVSSSDASSMKNHSSSTSILSEKVTRALEVRTDTPAMKAALEALAHLNTSDEQHRVDSRSVRVAIEQDALHQALLLKEELSSLLSIVQVLRMGVAETAAAAHKVRDAIYTPVVTQETAHSMLATSSTTGTSNESTDALSQSQGHQATAATAQQALQAEQELASQLADAFLETTQARHRVDAVYAFLDKFDLSPEDSRLLDHYAFDDVHEAQPINGLAFLRALERVRKIRATLSQTLGQAEGVSGQQDDSHDHAQGHLGASSALRMMESLASKQEGAYERLYHWLQRHLHLFNSSSSTAMLDPDQLDQALQHDFVKRALYVLRHVPAFYSHTLELISGSRRAEETRRFLLALTSGYGGLPPLEMKAHDSVAYVGDMLAFAFQAFSVEADVAKGIVLYQQDEDEQGEAKVEQEGGVAIGGDEADYLGSVEKPMTATAMLSISVSGLARPLKSRILQVVSTLARRPDQDDDQEDMESDDGMGSDDFDEEGHVVRTRLTHLYEICGLLLFYAAAMHKAIAKLEEPRGDDAHAESSVEDMVLREEPNPLIACLEECSIEATKAYEATIRVYGAMLSQLSMATGQSEASLAHAMLVLIADVRTSSPGFSSDVPCSDACRTLLSVEWVTETLVEAALTNCTVLDDVVTLKQTLAAVKNAGINVLVAEKLDEAIEQKEAALIEQFVEMETSKVLDVCGLGPMAVAWKRWQEVQSEGTLMATYPGLSPDAVEAGIKDFYASLYSPPLPSLETVIKDPVLRKSARSKIASRVCEVYSELYSSIMSSGQGGYDDVSFLGHTPEQVNTLFSG